MLSKINTLFIKNVDIKKNIWNKMNNMLPDLDRIFGNLIFKIKNFFNFSEQNHNLGGNLLKFLFFIFVFLFLFYFVIGFYIVKPAEQAVITRFGKYNRTVFQGPHWIPIFIEKKEIINTEKIERSSHGSSMLTRDENIVIVEIEVQYKINDVEKYLFKLVDPDRILREASDSTLKQTIENSDLDFIVTSGKEQIAYFIQEQIQSSLNNYEAGMYITTVALKEAKVPIDVKSAFDDVIKAQEEREQLKHQAEAFANRIVPEAKGKAVKMLEEASAYKQEMILIAEGDTAKFKFILPEYNKAPKITRVRMYLESIEEVLLNSTKILIDVNSSGNLFYFPIDKLMSNSIDVKSNKIDNVVNREQDIDDKFNLKRDRKKRGMY